MSWRLVSTGIVIEHCPPALTAFPEDSNMVYLKLFDRVVDHVKREGVKVQFRRGKPLTLRAFDKQEELSALVIPDSLVKFYFEVGDGLLLRWATDDDGPFCKIEFPKLSRLIAESLDSLNRQSDTNGNFKFPHMKDPQLARKTALRMQKWLGFHEEGNGDRFCVDTGKKEAPVVFDRHDWRDGGSGSNGHIMAKSLSEFFAAWAEVCFQFPKNLWWPAVFQKRGGIDWSSDQFCEPFRLARR
jgi:hypothetical protein